MKTQRIVEDSKATTEIAVDMVPTLKLSLEELAKVTLDPQEGFVLSRVNGDWDVQSIIKICPMSETDVLLIFKRLIDDGLIELR
jgi:hypothetical protein